MLVMAASVGDQINPLYINDLFIYTSMFDDN